MDSHPHGKWAIHYCKVEDITKWNVMKRRNSDGVLVSAKIYDDVFRFKKYHDAFEFCRLMNLEEPQVYDSKPARVCKTTVTEDDGFYLSNN